LSASQPVFDAQGAGVQSGMLGKIIVNRKVDDVEATSAPENARDPFMAGRKLALGHAAIPKKSLAVTRQPVANAIFAIVDRSGMRLPIKYRRTVSWLTPMASANSARLNRASARYA